MYAVIQTGGKQYRVAPGEELRVDFQRRQGNRWEACFEKYQGPGQDYQAGKRHKDNRLQI